MTKKWEFQNISDKINFKINTTWNYKEVDYMMIKGSTQEEDIILINLYYASYIRAPKNIKHVLRDIKGEIDGDSKI